MCKPNQATQQFLWGLPAIIILAVTLTACGGSSTSSPSSSIPSLYTSDWTGDIYVVNANGSTTLLINTNVSGVDMGNASGLLYHTGTGRLYAGTGGFSGAPNCVGCVYIINTVTGVATEQTSASLITAAFGKIQDMAERNDGTVFLTANDSLWSMDPSTHEVTLLGDAPCCGMGLTFDAAGTTLYDTGDSDLYTLDQTTGADTLVGAFNYIGFPVAPSGKQYIVAMATDASTGLTHGILNDALSGSGPVGPRYFITIDLTNANVTYVAVAANDQDGLTFVP